MLTTQGHRVSLYEAAATLQALSREIEEGGEVDELILQEFGKTRSALEESIDRRKALIRECDAKVEFAQRYKEDIDKHVNRIKQIQSRIRRLTQEIVEEHPDIPFRDSLGTKLSVCKAQPAVKFNVEFKAKKTLSHVLDPDMVELIGIDAKYVNEITCLILDVDAVKADLLAGVELPWARLEQTLYLRGL